VGNIIFHIGWVGAKEELGETFMLQDVKELLVSKNLVDEWSVYKVTKSNKQKFLLFSFGDQEEAIKKGRALAKVLNLNLKVEGGTDSTLTRPVKKRRVSGVTALCRRLLLKGKSTVEIENALIRIYENAGYSYKEARWAARGIVSTELRAGGSRK